MIAYLNGVIAHKSQLIKKDNFIIVTVSGVGYKVYVIDRLLNDLRLGQEVELYTYTQVAETVLDLYGFANQDDLAFFELLIGISGIGPRSALGILQKAKTEDIRQAVQSGNASVLAKVSGLGPKTAEKVVTGLKDKLGSVSSGAGAWDAQFGDALEALVGLGYSPVQARDALAQVPATEVGEQVKEALKHLGRK